MARSWGALIALLVSCTALGSGALASTGGAEVAEALGWDPTDRKAFFAIVGIDESGLAPRVVYFKSGGSPFGYVVDWSRGNSGDSTYSSKLRVLKKRLLPLPELSAPTIPEMRTVIGVDTLFSGGTRWPRFRVRARDLQCLGGVVLEATTIGDPDVRVIRQYWVPEIMRLGVISFRGVPYEMGYEVQIPVLFPEPGDTLRVQWKRRN